MTMAQIEKRVKALEQTIQGLPPVKPRTNRRWYRTHAGRFTNDPAFKEIVRLGRAYRQSQRPPRNAKPR